MATKLAGKGVVVQISVDDITYYTIASLNDASMSISGDNQDITTFAENLIVRMQGLKDVTYSLAGYFNETDTTGQIPIRTALVNDSALYVKFMANGAAGFKQSVRVSSWEVGSTVDGLSELSIELEGTDDISAATI